MTTKNLTLDRGFDQTFTALDLVPVSPSDTDDLAIPARALRIGGAGTLRITTYTGDVRDTNVLDGEVLLVFTLRVHSTGTSATNIEAMI